MSQAWIYDLPRSSRDDVLDAYFRQDVGELRELMMPLPLRVGVTSTSAMNSMLSTCSTPSVYDFPPAPALETLHCDFCGSEFHPSPWRPGACVACGAPKPRRRIG